MTQASKVDKVVKKKASKKKAKTAEILPEPVIVQPLILPRGRERMSDGSIRLKVGDHDLGESVMLYNVHGVNIELSGKVLVANKDVDWLSIGKCQKCGAVRSTGIMVRRSGDSVALTFRCQNTKGCSVGDMVYVQVHSPGRFYFVE